MPQMAPINWLLLFMMFTMIFLLFNIMNYYSMILKTPKFSQSHSMQTFSMNWKW